MRNVSVFLDGARWIAALLVAAGHLRNFLMVDWGEVVRLDLVAAGFYWLTGFGRVAVIIFFVLSGYLVGGRALGAIEGRRFNVPDYAIHRLSRLYPPLLVSIILTAILDNVGLRFSNSLSFYDFPNTYHITGMFHSVDEALGGRVAMLNMLFLQTIFGPTYGSNSPLWSLANEFWYYVFGPLVLAGIALARSMKVVVLFGVLSLTVVGGNLLGLEIVALGATWLAGALAYRYARRLRGIVVITIMTAFLCLVATIRSERLIGSQALVDLAVAAMFATLLWALGRPRDRESHSFSSGILARLAGFSYSLYLIHVPVCFLLAATALQQLSSTVKLQPGPVAYALFGVGLVISILLAYGVAQLTEARTTDIRRWITRKLGLRGASTGHVVQ